MHTFVAETDIPADLETGWRVLTDFARYPEWNPLLRRVGGEAKVGASLRLQVARTLGSDKTVFLPARVRVSEPGRELAWGGGVPGLLDVHHFFRFTPLAKGFRFTHGETFRGPLLTLIWPLVRTRVRQENYDAVNEAFRARCGAAERA